jgi:hypothetical protein
MFKKPEQITPLPSGMADAFSRTLERQGFKAPEPVQVQPTVVVAVQPQVVSEAAPAMNRIADKKEAPEKAKMVKMKDKVTASKSQYEEFEIIQDGGKVEPEDVVQEATMDERSCVGEMKKLHASHCSKTEMYKRIKEKYGYSEAKFVELYAQHCNETYEDVQEDNTNDKSDDGKGMDKVQPKALKKKFDDRKDKDINNDGETDSSDEYLHKRRKAISKALADESLDEAFTPKDVKMAIGIASDKRYAGGNMTGAVSAIEKIKKGLSDHPQVKAVLKKQNESAELDAISKALEELNDY